MNRLLLLDAGPTGVLSNPRKSEKGDECWTWLEARIEDGDIVMIPEIIDYEIRRELLRAGKVKGVKRLDELGEKLGLVPSGGPALIEAASLWAQARRGGYPTADDKALDGDVILAATAVLAARQGYEVIIATSNAGHLGRFADAREWSSIAGPGVLDEEIDPNET